MNPCMSFNFKLFTAFWMSVATFGLTPLAIFCILSVLKVCLTFEKQPSTPLKSGLATILKMYLMPSSSNLCFTVRLLCTERLSQKRQIFRPFVYLRSNSM